MEYEYGNLLKKYENRTNLDKENMFSEILANFNKKFKIIQKYEHTFSLDISSRETPLVCDNMILLDVKFLSLSNEKVLVQRGAKLFQ